MANIPSERFAVGEDLLAAAADVDIAGQRSGHTTTNHRRERWRRAGGGFQNKHDKEDCATAAAATAAVMGKIIKQLFPENYVLYIEGEGAEVLPPLFENFRFDKEYRQKNEKYRS